MQNPELPETMTTEKKLLAAILLLILLRSWALHYKVDQIEVRLKSLEAAALSR